MTNVQCRMKWRKHGQGLVIQSDQTNSVEVRSSPINGRGVFAAVPLPGRRKLGEIDGRLVKLPGARKAIAKSPKIYFVELDDQWALDCSDGGPFKHLNHSCEPNCYLRISRRRLEVYSLRPLAAGVELTVDYGVTPHAGGMTCRCGAAKCRRLL